MLSAIGPIARIDFTFMGFLPPVQTVPLLFPPDDDSCRKAALSINYREPGGTRVLGRAPADNTFWVGASDPILSQLRCRGLRTPNRKTFWTLYMQFYLFSALLKLTINNDRKI